MTYQLLLHIKLGYLLRTVYNILSILSKKSELSQIAIQEVSLMKRQRIQQRVDDKEQKQSAGSTKIKLNQNMDEKIYQKNAKEVLDLECIICTSPYNLNRKLPVIACKNNHTFCLNCIALSIRSLKPNCPMCRQPIQPNERNDELYQEVLQKYKSKNQHLQKILVKNEYKKISIGKFAKKHSQIDNFQFVPRSGKIIKIKHNNQASLLIFDPELKPKQITSFKFTYLPAGKVQISFGVCAYDKFLCKVVQNCGFDTKIIDFFMDKKQSILKVNLKKGIRIAATVDLLKDQIHWLQARQQQSDKKHSQTQLYLLSSQPIEINHKVGDLSYYPYCVLYNIGDSIELNK